MTKDLGKWIRQIPWIVVVIAALVISWQSLVFVAQQWGMDRTSAVLVSLSLDGVAISLAELTLRSTRTEGYSSWTARLFILVFTGVSVMLNMAHASILHKPTEAHLLYAVAPCAALIVFEEFLKFNRRNSKKSPPGPPEVGFMWWALFPVRCFKLLRLIGGQYLDRLEGKDTGEYVKPTREETALARSYLKNVGVKVGDKGEISRDKIELFRASQMNVGVNGSNGHHDLFKLSKDFFKLSAD